MSTYIRISEAAKILECSSQTIRNYIRAGKLDAVEVGSLQKVNKAQVENMLPRSSNSATINDLASQIAELLSEHFVITPKK